MKKATLGFAVFFFLIGCAGLSIRQHGTEFSVKSFRGFVDFEFRQDIPVTGALLNPYVFQERYEEVPWTCGEQEDYWHDKAERLVDIFRFTARDGNQEYVINVYEYWPEKEKRIIRLDIVVRVNAQTEQKTVAQVNFDSDRAPWKGAWEKRERPEWKDVTEDLQVAAQAIVVKIDAHFASVERTCFYEWYQKHQEECNKRQST